MIHLLDETDFTDNARVCGGECESSVIDHFDRNFLLRDFVFGNPDSRAGFLSRLSARSILTIRMAK
jgi:hypothetical protein